MEEAAAAGGARNLTTLDDATCRVMNDLNRLAISHRTGGVEKLKRFPFRIRRFLPVPNVVM